MFSANPVHVTEDEQKNPCEDFCVTLGSVEVISISLEDLYSNFSSLIMRAVRGSCPMISLSLQYMITCFAA